MIWWLIFFIYWEASSLIWGAITIKYYDELGSSRLSFFVVMSLLWPILLPFGYAEAAKERHERG